MFRDDRQIARVCCALLARGQVAHLWTDAGPTDTAVAVAEGSSGAGLSSGQAALVGVAFALWNGSGGLTVARALDVLDAGSLRAVGDLLVATTHGADAVDAWLQRQPG